MHVNDFRDDLKPTRGQWEQIARAWCEYAGEAIPGTRLEATELLLRLRETDPAATTPETAPAAQRPAGAPESPAQASRTAAGPIRLRRPAAGAARQ